LLVVVQKEPNGGHGVLWGNIIPGPPATGAAQGPVTVGPAAAALFLTAALAVELDVGLGAAFALRERSGRACREASSTAALGCGRLVLPCPGLHFRRHSSRFGRLLDLCVTGVRSDALQIFLRFEVLLLILNLGL